jgi:prepilin-type N-terminal cleavage/methylation domain-containing protein
LKRKGFTLIELMVVIAIIIILAAIAIPNYLSMTARAKRSRVASDFAAIATALETYKTDWNQYPPAEAAVKIAGTGVDVTGAGPACELVGGAGVKVNTGVTAAGETAPIEYMTANILTSMVNPYSTDANNQYMYFSAAAPAQHWTLYAPDLLTGAGQGFLVRTDLVTSVLEVHAAPAP